jgi:hypothetical protein
VREAEDGAVRIVGCYVKYGGYPGEDIADRRGKKPMGGTEEGSSQDVAPAAKRRKLGTTVGGSGGV